MVTATWPRRRHLPAYVALSTLLCAPTARGELFYTARSPAIQDGLINRPASTCPVAQDGLTTDTFPWTHNPACVDVVLPNEGDEATGARGHQTFCVYTNADYNNGRGVSFVVTPEVAASVTMETFGMSIGGMEGVVGEEMGMWEVKYAGEKGKGLFAKRDIAGIFPGESLIVQTPVLFVAKQLAATEERPQHVLKQAVDQLPARTREMVKKLDVNVDGTVEDIVLTNGIGVKWPWVDEVPELLAVVPEAARINHACRPNTLWRFDDYTLSFNVVALRDIKPGEEITRSYGYERRSRKRRVKTLMAHFGFECACPLCTGDDDIVMASNDRLSEIKALKSVLPTDEKDTAELLRLLPKLIEQLEEEGLLTELPQYEEILAYTWSSFGIEDRAKYWAERAQKHWAVVAGKESWEQRRCGELAENVKGHSTWMTWKGDPWEGVGEDHPSDEEAEGHEDGHAR